MGLLQDRMIEDIQLRNFAPSTLDTYIRYARKFADAVLRTHAGQTVLVAGHSNTVPLLIEALGVSPAPSLDESDYDDLFVVVVERGGDARLTHLHYGGTNESGEPLDAAE